MLVYFPLVNFSFLCCDSKKSSPECQLGFVSTGSSPCKTEKHSDCAATAETVRSHENSVKGKREKTDVQESPGNFAVSFLFALIL